MQVQQHEAPEAPWLAAIGSKLTAGILAVCKALEPLDLSDEDDKNLVGQRQVKVQQHEAPEASWPAALGSKLTAGILAVCKVLAPLDFSDKDGKSLLGQGTLLGSTCIHPTDGRTRGGQQMDRKTSHDEHLLSKCLQICASAGVQQALDLR